MSEDPNKAMASIPSHLDTLDNEELPTSQAPRSTYVIVTGLILIFGVMDKYLPMGS
jgi:hypothetical protein